MDPPGRVPPARPHGPHQLAHPPHHLLQAERRCTIAHELIHLERGPAPDDPWLRAREERAVEAEAARRLITLDALADALAWSDRPVEVAEELWVDVQTLDVRVDGLNPAERAELDTRLTDDEEGTR